ncbi:MAG: prepilin-type N-terminal cleavage/methylation domain-containing protein [Nitrospira sp.]|nr:prepilin-type N-terminal cleavage/methylation domain-containing protein [Nitrospira sp.]
MSKGYSLIELLITMAIFIFATLTLSRFFIAEHHIYAVQEADTEMQQTLRNIINVIGREIMLTGYGLPSQINSITRFDKEEIDFRTNLRDITSSLVSAAGPEQNIINVYDDSGGYFKKDDTIVICDSIAVNRCEEHKLSQNGTNNQLTLASGINGAFPAGSRINLINTISYRYNRTRREVQRKIDRGIWESIAENIPDEGMIFSYKDKSDNTPVNSSDISRIDIIITVESFRSDINYQDYNGYRRANAKSSVAIRNYL